MPLEKGDDEFVSGFRAGLNSVLRVAMPTVNWEECPQSVHYYHYSLERYLMSQTIDNLQMLLLLLISNSASGDSSGINAIILTLLTIMNFDEDLHRLRPSNFYPPDGFYPTGCHDDFWDRSDAAAEMFLMRFRFRVPHFRRLMTAMGLDGKAFTIGGNEHGHRFPADVCMMVLFRRLSYPNTFKQLATEFGIPSHRLCEIFHFALEYVLLRPAAGTGRGGPAAAAGQ